MMMMMKKKMMMMMLDDVSGKQAETDQNRATFKAKHGSSISPVDTMI